MDNPVVTSTAQALHDSLAMSERERELYQHIADGGLVHRRTPELDKLLALGLVIREPLQEGRYLLVPVGRVARRLLKTESDALGQSVARIAEIPALIADLRSMNPRDEPRGETAVQWLDGVDAVNEAIATAVDAATTEILAAQPGERPRTVLEKSMYRDADALRRGVAMRTLYHVSARSNPAVRQRVDIMSPLGGLYRTRSAMFMRCVVMDRRFAVVADHAEGRVVTAGGYVVRSPAVCAFIADYVELEWARAEDWYTDAPESGTVTTQIQRTILRMLHSGHDQQQAASLLGYSTKTVNTQLRRLCARLELKTVYQLMAWWGSAAASAERELD
ncbi:helix-turn-helix transcriptional regulator [Streptomyces alboflavus]|uniref:helix-turn-helix transcriptional regulator n=1 Tax=Streptomyces alboflavus TaxID=67267 RepID=UPI003698EBBB